MTWTGATTLAAGKPSAGSCASATSCMVTDEATIFVLSGTSWRQSAAPGGPLHGFTYSVSCPTSTYRLAVDWSGAYLVCNGATWGSPQTIGAQASAVDSVSCSSPGFCMAVDAGDANGLGGDIFIFNGTAGSTRARTGYCSARCPAPALTSARCHCVAVDWEGNALAGTGFAGPPGP